MADISDVQNALLAEVFAVVYPNGTTQPSAVTPELIAEPNGTTLTAVTGEIKLYAGWPQAEGLNNDLAAGVCSVTAFPKPGHDRAADLPLGIQWRTSVTATNTLTAFASQNMATFGGLPAVGQIATVSAFDIGYSYSIQALDKLEAIPVALAAIVNADGRLKATASGGTITITTPGGLPSFVKASTGVNGIAWREVAKRESVVTVSVWAPTPAARDFLGGLVDATVAGADYLTAPDGSAIKTQLDALRVLDSSENASLYRRDRDVLVQYSVIQTQAASPLLLPGGEIHARNANTGFGALLPITGIEVDLNGNPIVDGAGNPVTIPIGGTATGTTTVPSSPTTGGGSSGTTTSGGTSGGGQPVTFSPYLLFVQETPAAVWNITHNLGSFPAITLVDSAGDEFEADIKYISLNTILVTIAFATSGSAYLN